MMEGSDNNFPLTDCRVPWDESVKYNADEEYFEYNGEGNIDFDMGRTHEVDDGAGGTSDVPDDDIVEFYRKAWNWNYRWNCLINFYDGTVEDLKADKSANTKMAYWVTKSLTVPDSLTSSELTTRGRTSRAMISSNGFLLLWRRKTASGRH